MGQREHAGRRAGGSGRALRAGPQDGLAVAARRPSPDLSTIPPQEAVMLRYRRALDTWLSEDLVGDAVAALIELADEIGQAGRHRHRSVPDGGGAGSGSARCAAGGLRLARAEGTQRGFPVPGAEDRSARKARSASSGCKRALRLARRQLSPAAPRLDPQPAPARQLLQRVVVSRRTNPTCCRRRCSSAARRPRPPIRRPEWLTRHPRRCAAGADHARHDLHRRSRLL